MGCFALTCVCIWNGFLNSIQSVCRERGVVKREHRSGMYISSYICAHMIYQCMLCAAQTAILLGVCSMAGVHFPSKGLVSGSFMPDMAITMFLITYAADMMSLAISCLVKNTTTAMTVMPFMLIFQLVFSGAFISLSGKAAELTRFTIAKWGLRSMCTLGNYNSQPMVTLWKTIWKFRSLEVEGYKPIEMITNRILEEGRLNEFLLESGSYNTELEYYFTMDNILHCWKSIAFIAVVFAILSGVILSFIDKDKR